MGASAALCVAMSSWFCEQKMISKDQRLEFAKELEHLFHGKSSGLDIAGVASSHGVYFKQGQCIPINQVIQPMWFLSSCNQIGITSHCIHQVQTLWEKNPQEAQQIDNQMIESVSECRQALETPNEYSLPRLAKAMNNASDCFVRWGLVSESLQRHMDYLRQSGAIAVKPTGSGGGGFVLSLWQQEPELDIDLIAV
jgi:mevalonate kinase